MTSAQQKRLGGAILTLVVGGLAMAALIGSAIATPGMGYVFAPWVGLSALVIGLGVYLSIRFVQVLRETKEAPPA